VNGFATRINSTNIGENKLFGKRQENLLRGKKAMHKKQQAL
jgi:hypothetical protein